MDTLLVVCYAIWLAMVILLAGTYHTKLERHDREHRIEGAEGRYE